MLKFLSPFKMATTRARTFLFILNSTVSTASTPLILFFLQMKENYYRYKNPSTLPTNLCIINYQPFTKGNILEMDRYLKFLNIDIWAVSLIYNQFNETGDRNKQVFDLSENLLKNSPFLPHYPIF